MGVAKSNNQALKWTFIWIKGNLFKQFLDKDKDKGVIRKFYTCTIFLQSRNDNNVNLIIVFFFFLQTVVLTDPYNSCVHSISYFWELLLLSC